MGHGSIGTTRVYAKRNDRALDDGLTDSYPQPSLLTGLEALQFSCSVMHVRQCRWMIPITVFLVKPRSRVIWRYEQPFSRTSRTLGRRRNVPVG